LKGRVEAQLEALKKGLQEIVPLKELRVFDEKELEVSFACLFSLSSTLS
jgi:E3 ubiquitin-protein ligase NEDD4